ncbi:MAG TPA: RNase adapter RapZ [Acidobacteriota bacterium]|nr:RNase adapter RapZ [Acidobacteriota bacterium]
MSLQDLVIVTGMSGSGKGTVLNTFEDMGFFCVDNLPVPLIPKFIEGIHVSGGGFRRAALGIDIRAGEKLRDLERVLGELRKSTFNLFVLFLEARDGVLIRRFSETRRPHPLGDGLSMAMAIRKERRRLRKLKELADATIDTSDQTMHQVKAHVAQLFRKHPRSSSLKIIMMSFGYKHGIPLEADLVFDVRFLPNPFFVPKLKKLTGNDRGVKTYLRKFPEVREFIERVGELVNYLIPHYVREGKSQITVAIGCTGGRHRSVYVAAELAKNIKAGNRIIRVIHRDELL